MTRREWMRGRLFHNFSEFWNKIVRLKAIFFSREYIWIYFLRWSILDQLWSVRNNHSGFKISLFTLWTIRTRINFFSSESRHLYSNDSSIPVIFSFFKSYFHNFCSLFAFKEVLQKPDALWVKLTVPSKGKTHLKRKSKSRFNAEHPSEEQEDEEEEEEDEQGEGEGEGGRIRLTRSPSSLYRRRRGEKHLLSFLWLHCKINFCCLV